jgi:signal transduction histidine kinase
MRVSFFRGGIRRRLMVWGLGLVGGALGLNTIAGSIYTRRQIEQSTGAFQSEIATLTARHIQTYITRKIERLEDSASAFALHPIGSEEQKLLAYLLLKNDGSFSELSVLDDKGRERIKISERLVYLASDLGEKKDSAAYLSAIQGQNYIGQVRTSDRAEPYLTLAVPLKTAPRKSAGVLVAKTNLKFLWDVVREKKFNRGGYVYLINETGDLIAHQDSSLVLKHPTLVNLPKVRDYLASPSIDRRPGARGMGIAGDEVLSTYAPVPELGWAVVLEEPMALALGDVEKLEWFTKILLAAGLLFGSVIIVLISERITRPILELRRSAEIIGNGNLNHRVNIDTGDEIAELGAKFNQMAGALRTSYATLEEKVELRTQEISALYDVARAVNQSLVIDSVLNDVIKQVTERFRFDTTRIFLFDSLFENLTLRAFYNTSHAPELGVGPFRKGESVAGRVAESGKPAFFADIQTDPRYHAWSESKAAGAAGFHFLAALPIKTKTMTFGAVTFSGREPRQLNDQEVRLLNAMCDQVAVAVEKASLFEEASKRSEELSRTNQELAKALRVKSEFVAGMSHELRTPLNVIMGYAKMTEEGMFGAINVEQKDAQQKISRHAEVLLKMVNEVLSLSRVEAKELSLDIGKVYVDELFAQLKGQVEPLNRDRCLEFTWNMDKNIPPLVSDPLKLEEILQNLIGNAIKFTPKGQVVITARNLAERNRVEFSVADSGIGIEEDEIERIFNAFEQGKDAHTGNRDGVGLGLSIIKKYLELMQGEIHVKSHIGEGSTFTFTVPYNLDNPAQAAA